MPLADHIIFGAYGFWLPNDPRGSGSDFVRQNKILQAGPPTKVNTRSSVAHVHANFDADLPPKLLYPPVLLTGQQALTISRGFAQAIKESTYILYACSILPTHIHLIAARHAHTPTQLAGHLKARATQALTAEARHPLAHFKTSTGVTPSPWSVKSWTVFLDTPADIRRAITYVENNPLREGKKPQHWPFVTSYKS